MTAGPFGQDPRGTLPNHNEQLALESRDGMSVDMTTSYLFRLIRKLLKRLERDKGFELLVLGGKGLPLGWLTIEHGDFRRYAPAWVIHEVLRRILAGKRHDGAVVWDELDRYPQVREDLPKPGDGKCWLIKKTGITTEVDPGKYEIVAVVTVSDHLAWHFVPCDPKRDLTDKLGFSQRYNSLDEALEAAEDHVSMEDLVNANDPDEEEPTEPVEPMPPLPNSMWLEHGAKRLAQLLRLGATVPHFMLKQQIKTVLHHGKEVLEELEKLEGDASAE
jgi:hypothetical protein